MIGMWDKFARWYWNPCNEAPFILTILVVLAGLGILLYHFSMIIGFFLLLAFIAATLGSAGR